MRATRLKLGRQLNRFTIIGVQLLVLNGTCSYYCVWLVASRSTFQQFTRLPVSEFLISSTSYKISTFHDDFGAVEVSCIVLYISRLLCLQEDLWRPVNFQNAESMKAFESEMKELGLTDIHSYTYGG